MNALSSSDLFKFTRIQIRTKRFFIPLALERVAAGFPSPAIDHTEDDIDFNELLVGNKSATFTARVKSESMIGIGIGIGDLIVVDRSIKPVHRHIVIAKYNGDYTLKRLMIEQSGNVWLKPESTEYQPIIPREGDNITIWGVVTFTIKNMIHC
ncbi:MAG: translesion error-prone DNA polymerase V autoproteolytic subunit [Gammaproteobacteria bacterium]|nr:translesion error-prone DNA polymerase V autoproteolytic subunit [Gammaproteobacteria bacterium]